MRFLSTAFGVVLAGCTPDIPPHLYRDSATLDVAVAADRVYLIDSRTPVEYATGHIPGAVNIPHKQTQAAIARVPKNKDIVLYCKVGGRSQKALDVLREHGYTRVFNFGGIGDYEGTLRQVESK